MRVFAKTVTRKPYVLFAQDRRISQSIRLDEQCNKKLIKMFRKFAYFRMKKIPRSINIKVPMDNSII